jgi:hypothetical protein
MLQNIFAKFRANLRSSGNRDAGKEALKGNYSFLVEIITQN